MSAHTAKCISEKLSDDECPACSPGSYADAIAHRERDELRAEVVRLRGLIKEAEMQSEGGHWDEAVCPWCRESSHTATCRAFTPEGEVR